MKLDQAVTVRFTDDEIRVLDEQVTRARQAFPEYEVTRASILRASWRRVTLGAPVPDVLRETIPVVGIVPTS